MIGTTDFDRAGGRGPVARWGVLGATGARGLTALLAVLCIGAPAFGANDRPVETAISIGYGAIDGDFALGIRVGAPLTRRTGLEVAAEFVPSRGDFSDLYSRLMFQLVLRPGGRLEPYLSGGAGGVTAVGMGDRRTDFAATFGGGVRAALRPGLAARIDVEEHLRLREGETDARPGIMGGLLFLF